MNQTDLITMVSHILAIASERGDEPIRVLCEELGHRLVAEAEPKEAPVPVLVTEEIRPIPDDSLILKQQLNETRLRLEQWVVNSDATKCPECVKRKAQNLEAQKKWREKAAKKPKKAKRGNSKLKNAEVPVQ